MKSSFFWDITARNPLKRSFGVLATCFHAGFLLGVFFDLVEMTFPSETSGDLQRTTRRYIPGDVTRVTVSFL
jgi:hypothetical protein